MAFPATTTSTTAVPSNPYLALREGHGGLFFRCVNSAEGGEEEHRLGALGGVPVEVFLCVMSFVREAGERLDDEEDDDGGGGSDSDDEEGGGEGGGRKVPYGGEPALVRASQVCVGWRKAVLGCGKLWDELREVRGASFAAVERVRAVAGRSKGSLRHLSVTYKTSGDIPLTALPVVVMLKQIFREVSTLDGARNLRELEINLKPFKFCEDAEVPFNLIVLAVQFAEFSAVNLQTLRVLSHVDRYPSGAPFFFALPSLHKLVLSSASYDPPPESRLPDFFQTASTIEAAQVSACQLQVLVLSGSSLMDGNYASFPRLRVIKLYEVKCSNLYGLLSKCAATLETLWLRRVTADPSNRFLPPAANGGVKDLPPVLELPRLNDVSLAGALTPMLWVAPTQNTSHFIVSSPVLKSASFATRPLFATTEDGEYEADGIHNLTVEGLSTLFRNSPWLAKLDLTGTNVTSELLVSSLPSSSASLTHLKLGETNAATDAFIDRLHVLVPQLQWIDVYGREGYSVQKVTVMALARLAKRLKGMSPVRRWLSPDWKVTLVTRKPHHDNPKLSDLRQTLRALLVTLSPSQLDHLISSALVLNSPPNALPFASVKAELLALGTPPPPPNANGSGTNGAVFGSSMANGAGLGLGGGGVGKKKPKQPPVVPAPQNILDEARAALVVWQKRREEDWAVEWCAKEGGVELRWGQTDCWDLDCNGCEKGHPGWEQWMGGEDEDR
ncbi:hypothetical protein JCM6882_002606 [Rhodosporidiobolus microsporus]